MFLRSGIISYSTGSLVVANSCSLFRNSLYVSLSVKKKLMKSLQTSGYLVLAPMDRPSFTNTETTLALSSPGITNQPTSKSCRFLATSALTQEPMGSIAALPVKNSSSIWV